MIRVISHSLKRISQITSTQAEHTADTPASCEKVDFFPTNLIQSETHYMDLLHTMKDFKPSFGLINLYCTPYDSCKVFLSL